MIILAGEDVGLADPNAISVVISCAQAFDRIGFPEGNFPLVEACLYLATAPKSNSALNFFDVMKEVEKEDAEVPSHLRDASRDSESFGHGEGYVYPHAYRDHWAAQQYLPSSLVGKIFYMPSRMGYEGKIREEDLRKRELQAAIVLGDGAELAGDGEALTWSASSKGREGWFKRLESGRSGLLLSDRERILGAAKIKRHDRILIAAGGDGLLLWESLRRAPEGLCACLVENEAARDTLLHYAATLDEAEQPRITVCPAAFPSPSQAEEWFGSPVFDHLFARELWRRLSASSAGDIAGVFRDFAENAREILAPEGDLAILQSPPRLGERISRILREDCEAEQALAGKLEEAEEAFFSEQGGSFMHWDGADLEGAFRERGFEARVTVVEQKEERLISSRDLGAWFDREHSRWGSFIGKRLGDAEFTRIEELLRERIKKGPLVWKWKSLLLTGTRP
jgi:putative ATPase